MGRIAFEQEATESTLTQTRASNQERLTHARNGASIISILNTQEERPMLEGNHSKLSILGREGGGKSHWLLPPNSV